MNQEERLRDEIKAQLISAFISLVNTGYVVNFLKSVSSTCLDMWRLYRSPSICSKKSVRFSRQIVTAQEVRTFQQQGVVCLRGVFGEWIERLTKGIAKNHANPSKFSEWLTTEESAKSFYFNDFLNWRKIPEFEEFVYESPAGEVAGKLMEAEYAVFYHEHVFTKDPGTNHATPWHHDQPYYPMDGWKNCSLWIPVTPVSKESCLTYVGGSHKWGRWFVPRKFESLKNYKYKDPTIRDSDKDFEDIPDIDAHPENYELFAWDLEPGDCIAFHMQTLHGAKQSRDTAGRKVVATRWLGEDATFAERPWETSPNYTGGLKPGDPFNKSEAFPTVWRPNK